MYDLILAIHFVSKIIAIGSFLLLLIMFLAKRLKLKSLDVFLSKMMKPTQYTFLAALIILIAFSVRIAMYKP